MNKTFIGRGWRNWFIGLAVVALSACVDEETFESGTVLRDGEISLQWVAANMGQVVTKGTDLKTDHEKKINNVHVFLFDSEGYYLEPGDDGRDAFQGYRHLTNGGTSWILEPKLFANQEKAENATVYVLANVPEGTFADSDGNGKPDKLENEEKTPLEALEEMVIGFPEGVFTTGIPETGLPMVLRQDGVNVSEGATTKIVTLQLRSMMARIDLDFTMQPLQESGNLPSLAFTKVYVGNFPKGGIVKSQLVDGKTETVIGEYGLTEQVEVENAALLEGVLRKGNEQHMTLYMFEHAREAKKTITYPDGIDSDREAQRYKNDLAKEDAAYVELEGTYTTQNELVYNIIYRIYVGANPENDFTIKPNCQYKNNIVITGITVNNRDPKLEALLDTRVDVDSDPAFIEMLREQMFDAHFNVTPMDIYLREGAESVTVTILNESGQRASADEMKWIRMEPYYYAPKDKCEYKDNEGGFAASRAGDGKRKYFTTNLLSEMTNGYNRSYTVTQPEERIYFYMDENVPTQEQARQGEDVSPRSVKVRITYKAENGNESSQIATFRQAGMRSVYFDKFTNASMWGTTHNKINRQAYYFYIEEYEEYLAHYDGKNTYSETYEGLEWGLDGLLSGLGVQSGYGYWQFMSWGWYNTNQIMEKCREEDSWTNVEGREYEEMTLNTKPSGAAEYCYNKNKRNEDGTVPHVEWYLPTISELEYAIDKYYGLYEVFQDKWYWSSNPGAEGVRDPNEDEGISGDNGEDTERARGTKSLWNGREYVHARSAANEKYPSYKQDGVEKEGGNAMRDVKFRIRAAYIPNSSKPRDVDPYKKW